MVVDPRTPMRSRILVGCIGAVLLFCFNPARADQVADRSQLLAIKESRSLAAECDLAIDLFNSNKTSAIFTKALLAQAQAQLAEAASNLLTSPYASQLVTGAAAAISKRDLSELRAVTRALLELEQGG
jgi:hypothetical protein